ncbi:hypothetical protein U8527_02530 [Kordia algicida OT-1]|uniref:Uncharacterized protein n=1 Tax=Kordia algicida OT-1 TaxID=391587 RepID=A9DNG7_9FLAO|nr:hypothetical protein [Kordia algicida]EDP97187.1 hypothetical protein KAOT1_18532 [Kordia algicida OT-1]
MSSYNDNLHSSVVSSLSAQELELQKVEAKREASMFSLYYAQGARITTAEELEITNAKYAFEKLVHEQAIIDSDVSTNVLTSANNAKDYTAKSVTNTSVAAANVQIAANAILKLASDTGSIFSIINAADFDTDIYAQSNKASVLMNDTAYAAEQASQHSMEASSSIAEVTTANLDSKATVTDSTMKDLLSVVSKQFDDTTTLLATQSAELATANTEEKQAEGILEDLSVGYEATEEAYKLSNDELNMSLTIKTPVNVGNHDYYTVSFDSYKSAFQEQTADGTPKPTNQPVQNYNIILVENSKSPTFSMNDAEGIITGGYTDRYFQITPTTPLEPTEPIVVTNTNHTITQKFYISGESTAEKPVLKDSDGNPLELGKEYTIYVLTVFTMAYKKVINTFDDYLSAPSKMFILQNQLNAANANTIREQKNVTDGDDPTAEAADIVTTPTYQVIDFGVFKKPAYEVEYRCVFLPNNPNLVNGLLTVEEIDSIENNVQRLNKIENIYDLEVSLINDQIHDLTVKTEKLKMTIADNKKKIDAKSTKESTRKKLISENEKNEENLKEEEKNLTSLQASLATLRKIKELAISNVNIDVHIQPGFFFNLTTAEKISAGSYTVAEEITPTDTDLHTYINNSYDKIQQDIEAIEKALISENDIKGKTELTAFEKNIPSKLDPSDVAQIQSDIEHLRQTRNGILEFIIADEIVNPQGEKLQNAVNEFIEDCDQLIIDLLQILDGYTFKKMQVTLAAETTDNFGNRLINNNMYIPTIISVTNNTDETVNSQFINALSDFNHTTPIKYIDPYANPDKVVTYSQLTTNQS